MQKDSWCTIASITSLHPLIAFYHLIYAWKTNTGTMIYAQILQACRIFSQKATLAQEPRCLREVRTSGLVLEPNSTTKNAKNSDSGFPVWATTWCCGMCTALALACRRKWCKSCLPIILWWLGRWAGYTSRWLDQAVEGKGMLEDEVFWL